MMRNYKRKTDRGRANEDQFKAAIADVDNGTSFRETSRIHGLCPMSLCRYIKKVRAGEMPISPGYSKYRQVFTELQESLIASYLQQSAKRHFWGDWLLVKLKAMFFDATCIFWKGTCL